MTRSSFLKKPGNNYIIKIQILLILIVLFLTPNFIGRVTHLIRLYFVSYSYFYFNFLTYKYKSNKSLVWIVILF